MANGDDKTRRVLGKWAMYAVLLVVFVLMVTVIDPRETAGERIAFTFGAFITLALYSFLFGENEIYRFTEHLIVGIMAAQMMVMGIQNQLYPYWIKPMLTGLRSVFGEGQWDPKVLWVLAPFFGAFWYMIYSKKYLWLSRVVAVFIIGAGLGKMFEANFKNIVNQAAKTFKPLVPSPGMDVWAGILEVTTNFVFIACTLLVLFYFIFTLRVGERRWGRGMLSAGRIVMMLAFGVLFATIVSTRMGLLIGRLNFLIIEWAEPIFSGLGGG